MAIYKKWERRIIDRYGIENQCDESYECPMKCGEPEEHGHYSKCKKIINQPLPIQLRKSIRTWLEKTLCEENLMRLIMTIIVYYQKGELKLDGILNEVKDTKYEKFIEEQNKIGWDNFLKGFISIELKIAQQDNYDKIDRNREINGKKRLSHKYTGEWWMKNLIKQIMYFSLSHWQIRNEEEHKTKEKLEKINYRTLLKRKVLECYENKEQIGKEYQYLFDMVPLDRCMKPELNIEGWLKTIESCKKN